MTIDWTSINRQLDETLKCRAHMRYCHSPKTRNIQQLLTKAELEALRREFVRNRTR